MNALSFLAKRCHLKAVRLNTVALSLVGITPARLDLLQAIARRPYDSAKQISLAVFLGVSRQTIGKMLIALEKLGLVLRGEDDADRRCLFVELTEAGRALLDRVRAIYLRSGVAAKAEARMLVDLPRNPEKNAAFAELANTMRYALDDCAGFMPERHDIMKCDAGAPLAGDDRLAFDAVCDYMRWRFRHLPLHYLITT